MFRTATILAATAIGLVGAVSPASADGPPLASLLITVSHSHHDGSPAERIVGTLTCSPDGGIHDDPATACAELVGADGDLAAADHEMEGACPMHFAPTEVRAVGWYDGELLTYGHTYGNSCFFAATASAVWDV